MSNSPHETLLCRYHYDPLDRQSGCTLPQQPVIQRFHGDGRLTTEIQGGACWSILQYGDHLLAQRNHLEASVTATLLATDQQRSVLNALDASGPHPIAYTPYGHHPALHRLLSRRGFNGEQPDLLTGDYHLGNGYRQFNTVLMRFNSPDSWSPFGEGGLNAYGYCNGDPLNRVDPTGHSFITSLFKGVKNLIGVRQPGKFHKQKINDIINGAELNYNGEIMVERLNTKTAKPIDLAKLSQNKLTLYTATINSDSRPIYEIVNNHLYITPPEQTNTLRNLTSGHKVLTHSQTMPVPKLIKAFELANSVKFNREVNEAKKLIETWHQQPTVASTPATHEVSQIRKR